MGAQLTMDQLVSPYPHAPKTNFFKTRNFLMLLFVCFLGELVFSKTNRMSILANASDLPVLLFILLLAIVLNVNIL